MVGKKNNSYLSLSTEINLGEDILVGGYPLSNKINSSTIKITKGIVSSMSGKDNNYSEFQLDATVQPGNSGGPIINEYGNLVGVTSYMLTNAQNTNFAKKSDTLKMLMDSNKISYFENKNKNKIDTVELSSKLNDATLQIFCANTESNWTKLINQNKVSTEAASFLK